MKITPVKTEKLLPVRQSLTSIIEAHIPSLPNGSVLAVTAKIIALCQGRFVKIGEGDKDELVRNEAEYYLSGSENRYGIPLTIKHNILVAWSGIDESNGAGTYVLWPDDPQGVANELRRFLVQKYGVEQVGVIITDSRTTPLRMGVTGVTIAHSGFAAINNYIGKPDLFGVTMKVTRVNVMDGLGAAAVLVTGEGDEQTPLTVIEDVPFVQFQPRDPTADELAQLSIALDDDLFAPLLRAAHWHKGGA